MSNKLTSNPVTPNDEMLDLLKDWVAPDVTEIKRKELEGKTNFLGVPINEMYSRLAREEEVEVEEVPQLTAEEIEQIRQDAYEEGFKEGKADGYQAGFDEGQAAGVEEGQKVGKEEGMQQGILAGQTEIQQQAKQWQQLIEQLYDPIKRVDKAVEMQLLDLAVSLAEAVIRTDTKCNKDVLLNILHESVLSLPFNTEYVELHLHPADIQMITEVYDEATLIEKKWIIKEEPGYNQGDLIIATPNSLIDRTLKQRMKQTLDAFVATAALDNEQVVQDTPITGDYAAGVNRVGSSPDKVESAVQGGETSPEESTSQTQAPDASMSQAQSANDTQPKSTKSDKDADTALEQTENTGSPEPNDDHLNQQPESKS